MGEVYRARDARLDRDVALKVLPESLAADPQALARFEREAKVLAALSHPNILTIFDVGSDAGVAFVVTELLRGETLRERIRRSPIPWREAQGIAVAIAESLAAAHAKGVVHGDVKPDNLFITEEGVPKILDFGLAELLSMPADTTTRTVTVSRETRIEGTIPYMAPERVRGDAPSPASDLYAFGCTLFEMLTGMRPFTGPSFPELLASILRDPAPRLGEDADAPSGLDQVVHACLQKDPEDRIRSASELAVALRAVSGSSSESLVHPIVPRQPSKRFDSVAVLPILDTDGTSETEYLCDGITERVIDGLSRVPALRVMARSTVFRFKRLAVDPQSAGKELGVRGVLVGLISHLEEDWLIRMELVDALDGARVWGFERKFGKSELAEIPDALVAEISARLRSGGAVPRRETQRERPRRSAEAFRLYLQGRFYWNKRTRDGLLRSLELFDRAVEEDPRFALAHAGLADAYAMLGGFLFLPPEEAYASAKREAEIALEIDPGLGEPHCSLAQVKYRYEWDWIGAEREFRFAIHANPGYATAHSWYGVYLVLMQRFDEGTREIDRALELDPLSVVARWTRGYLLYYMRRFEDALDEYRTALALDPTFARVHIDVGLVFAMQGRFEAAIEEIRKAIGLLEQSPALLASLGWAHGVAGDRSAAEKILEELRSAPPARAATAFATALVHVGLGQFDAAFESFEASLARREDALVSLKVNPRLDPLRQDPRFTSLVRRVGMP
jgi:serine/threonine-protein kinase